MRVEGATVLITGAACGIGKAAVVEFLKLGAKALDVSAEALRELEAEIGCPDRLLCLQCDITRDEEQAAAFRRHVERWGALDVALLNAGISESGDLFGADSLSDWQCTLDVDLRAALTGIHLAARTMQRSRTCGVIVSVASAAGVFALPDAPVYSAAKGGLVHFTRSAAQRAAAAGLRLCAVCPQFVDTALVAGLPPALRSHISTKFGALLQPAAIAAEVVRLVRDDSKNGVAAVVLQDGRRFEWNPVFPVGRKPPAVATDPNNMTQTTPLPRVAPAPSAGGPLHAAAGPSAALAAFAQRSLPRQFRAWYVKKLSNVFAEATELVWRPMPAQLALDEVLVRRCYAGVNASDVNFTSGKYHGSRAEAERQLPFAAGFESVGVVVKAGQDAGLRPGTPVATFFSYGGFSEFTVERARNLLRVPAPSGAAIAMLTSGLTASIALEQVGRLVARDTVLVTAAAGGTGMFATQLAKLAGCTVIGTCSSDSKAALLRRFGVDRVVNYKRESLKAVLKSEFPQGIDVVYESVGGEMFDVAVDALANKGRLIVIGMMSQYGDGWPVRSHPGLPEKLLKKSATIGGFFLPQYAKHFDDHLRRLFKLHASGALQVVVDPTRFVGIEAVPAAVQHLQSGASSGKVVVQIAQDLPDNLMTDGGRPSSKL